MTEVNHKDDIFALPEGSYDVAKLTDYYTENQSIITNKAVFAIKLNPPYNLMVDLSKISTGRGERTRTFDLAVPNRAR
jgi:hypothetical protein